MKTFNVGPSRISEATKNDIREAVEKGILEISHRSEDFSRISESATKGLRKFLDVPDDYEILYTASATHAMQIALANCCKQRSFHFVCGSFSNLFAKVAQSLGKETQIETVESGLLNDYEGSELADDIDFISITQNETSTGVQVSMEQIKYIRDKNPDKILAVDITSSAGASFLHIPDADIWFFSVQKCFGLPAGLGIIILSERAIEKAENISGNDGNFSGYFSLASMLEKMKEKYQTLDTPNVLNIYLLSKVLERWNEQGGLEENVQRTKEKAKLLAEFIETQNRIKFFAKDKSSRSTTVFCLEADEEIIKKIHILAEKQELIIGKGYGELKNKTFRVANFPNIHIKDIEEVIGVLRLAL